MRMSWILAGLSGSHTRVHRKGLRFKMGPSEKELLIGSVLLIQRLMVF